MQPLAIFGINSSGVSLAIELCLLVLGVLYVSLLYWTLVDARRRIDDPLLIACSVAASLFPFVGTLVYMILRPPEYLVDMHERELEMRAAEARLAELGYELCRHCGHSVERDFLRCPSCLQRLKEPCASCRRPLDPSWSICPYCEAEVPGAHRLATSAHQLDAGSTRTRSRRRASIDAEQPVTAHFEPDLQGDPIDFDLHHAPFDVEAEPAPSYGAEPSQAPPDAPPRLTHRPA